MSVSSDDPYPAQGYSVSQLLHAAKRKLRGSTFGGRATATFDMAEVDALEHDALEVLGLVRSMRNTFAPVNRTPPEILSLIPGYLEEDDRDENLIVLTHVCRRWREIFVSCPSLWTRLDANNVEQTRVYIERSKSVPLEIYLGPFHEEEAFLLAIPHIRRLKTLSIYGDPDELLPVLVEHFSCPLPLLDDLTIDFHCYQPPTLPENLLGGGLSSLCKLTLGAITPLPWGDLSNLTTFKFHDVPSDKILLTQLLDFFESAPYLRHIQLHYSLPSSSNAPTERVVPLPYLKNLSIDADQSHSILLNHLSIPAGASLRLGFKFYGEHPPISSYLPKSPDSLPNLSHITAANLWFDSERRFIRLGGPSGELYILGNRTRKGRPNAGTSQMIQYLGQFDISRIRWLAITRCDDHWPSDPAQITRSTLYRTLYPMEHLRTLMLIQCRDLPFIHALNPYKNPKKVVLCPSLEKIVIYFDLWGTFFVEELTDMAEERAWRGVKLPAIRLVSKTTDRPAEEAFLPLSEHVECVEYTFDSVWPGWDILPS